MFTWKKKYSYQNNYFKFYLISLPGSKFNWTINGRYGISGYHQGDASAKFHVKQEFTRANFIYLNAGWDRYGPSYMLNTYKSNRYTWNNNFKQIIYSYVTIGYTSLRSRFNISANYGLVYNMIYIDSISPVQYTQQPITIGSLSVSKLFSVWKFKSLCKFEFEIASSADTIIRLPKFSVYNSTYFDHTFHFRFTGGQLHVQAGGDLYWNSAFMADAFNPETGLFYQQNLKLLGNSPYIDVFGKFSLKRFLFFLKYEYVNYSKNSINYFNALHYPMDTRAFKLGVTWLFYD